MPVEVRCVRPGATCLLQRARWETPHPHSRGSWERALGTSPPSASITNLQPGPAPVTLVTPAFDHHLPSISDVVNLWVPSSPIGRPSDFFLSESEFGEVRTLAALTSFCPSQGLPKKRFSLPWLIFVLSQGLLKPRSRQPANSLSPCWGASDLQWWPFVAPLVPAPREAFQGSPDSFLSESGQGIRRNHFGNGRGDWANHISPCRGA